MTSNTRTRVIEGLRQLADYLDRNPAVPVDEFGWTFSVHPTLDDDERGRAEIERIAALMGVQVASTGNPPTDYAALRRFGAITYEAIYITARRMAAHDALMSYRGVISPDTDLAADRPEAA